MSADDDLALLRRWRDGDADAGNRLFLRHFPGLRRFFRSKVDRAQCEDLIQRTFLQCLESIDRYQAEGSFRGYLFGIARFVFFAHVRGQFRDADAIDADFSTSCVRDFGTSPSMLIAARESGSRIAEAMQRIPVDFQITLELFYWEQLTGPEIAAALGISPVTVRTRLTRARAALRDALVALELPGTARAADADLDADLVALRDEVANAR